MKNFIWRLKEFGLKITLDLYVIDFAKWFLKAKNIKVTYYVNK